MKPPTALFSDSVLTAFICGCSTPEGSPLGSKGANRDKVEGVNRGRGGVGQTIHFMQGFIQIVFFGMGIVLSASAATNTVTCNFDTRLTVGPMNGILEGWNGTEPSEELIEGVGNDGDYARIFINHDTAVARGINMGYRVVARLDRYQNLTGLWPYSDTNAWKAWCAAKAEQFGTNVVYDVWNEPNLSLFWSGSKTQFFEAYRNAYTAIKAVTPDAEFCGPSVHYYYTGYIKDFLDYCLAHDLTCEYLSWHELRERDGDIPSLEDNLLSAISSWRDNPAYGDVGIKKVFIGETVGDNRTYQPGSQLGYFYYLEKGGADGACNSCWNNDCEKQSLSGLLTETERLPRAVYYVFQQYRNGVAYRTGASTTSDERVIALPSWRTKDDPFRAQVLIGYFQKGTTGADCDVDIRLNNLHSIPFLADRSLCFVEAHRVDNTGSAASDGLERIDAEDEWLDIDTNGQAVCTLENVGLEEMWLLSIYPPEFTPDRQAPSLPSNVTATAMSAGRIDLNWSASTDDTGVAGYDIRRDGSYLRTVTDTNYSDIGLTPSTVYSYTLEAFDASGNRSGESEAAQVETLTVAEPLLCYFPLDETGGVTAADVSGNDNLGEVLHGAAWMSGAVDGALAFDGLDDELSVSRITGLESGNTPHTLAAWVKIHALPPVRSWIALLGESGPGSHIWLLKSDGSALIGVWGGPAIAPVFPVGRWVHVAVTFDGSRFRGYVNGVFSAERTLTYDLTGVSLTLAREGWSSEDYFNGSVDDLRIYNRALTDNEIVNLLESADTDGDGMSNAFELRYGGNMTNWSAVADADEDGLKNVHEYIAATDPTNKASVFRVESLERVATTNSSLIAWRSASNRMYRVLSSTNLSVRFDLLADNLTATPPLNVYTDTAERAECPCFYKVEVRLPLEEE